MRTATARGMRMHLWKAVSCKTMYARDALNGNQRVKIYYFTSWSRILAQIYHRNGYAAAATAALAVAVLFFNEKLSVKLYAKLLSQ